MEYHVNVVPFPYFVFKTFWFDCAFYLTTLEFLSCPCIILAGKYDSSSKNQNIYYVTPCMIFGVS